MLLNVYGKCCNPISYNDVLASRISNVCKWHDDVIRWKHFPRYWPFVRGIHWSPVNSHHKDQWRGALMFSLICTWINGWLNSGEAGYLRRYRAHYDVTVMINSIKNECASKTWIYFYNALFPSSLKGFVRWTLHLFESTARPSGMYITWQYSSVKVFPRIAW